MSTPPIEDLFTQLFTIDEEYSNAKRLKDNIKELKGQLSAAKDQGYSDEQQLEKRNNRIEKLQSQIEANQAEIINFNKLLTDFIGELKALGDIPYFERSGEKVYVNYTEQSLTIEPIFKPLKRKITTV